MSDTGRWMVGKVWNDWDSDDEFSWIVVRYQRAAHAHWKEVTIYVDWELAENEQELILSFRLNYTFLAPKKRGEKHRELTHIEETYPVLTDAINRAKSLLCPEGTK